MNVESNSVRKPQRMKDENGEGGNGLNGSRSSTCSRISIPSTDESHSFDVLNVESHDADTYDPTSMTYVLLPTPDAPPASDLSKLFTIARRPVIVANLFALLNYPQPNRCQSVSQILPFRDVSIA